MARQKPSDQIATLLKQQAALETKLKKAKAKADAEAKETERRKNELVGAIARNELQVNPSGVFGTALRELLQTGMTKTADRVEFGLTPLPRPAKSTKGGSEMGNG